MGNSEGKVSLLVLEVEQKQGISWWWLNQPIEKKYARQNGFIFPNNRGENKTTIETT